MKKRRNLFFLLLACVMLCACDKENQAVKTTQPAASEKVSEVPVIEQQVSEAPVTDDAANINKEEDEKLSNEIIEQFFADNLDKISGEQTKAPFLNQVYEENEKVIAEYKGMLDYYLENKIELALDALELDLSSVTGEGTESHVLADLSYTQTTDGTEEKKEIIVTFYFKREDDTTYVEDIDWGELLDNVPFDIFVKADGFYEEQAITEFLNAFNDSVESKQITSQMQDILDFEIGTTQTKDALTKLLNEWIAKNRIFQDFLISYDPEVDIVELGDQREEMKTKISYCDESGKEQTEEMTFEFVYFDQERGYYTGQRGITITNLSWDKLEA